MQTKTIKIEELKAAEYNPRKISDKELAKLKDSVKEYGFIQPVVVNQDYTIIGGHQRVKAAKILGMESVPCVVLDLDKDREKILNIKLNKVQGTWDDTILAELLEDLNDLGKLKETGFSDKELQKLQFQAGNDINRKLIDDFIIPPFSIFDTKQGYWQDRKRDWIKQIGDSGEGRADNLITDGMARLGEVAGGGLSGTSIFDPVLAEVIYNWFCDKGGLIIDPFAGGTTRGIVASILGYKYIGTDLSKEQIEANIKQAKELKEKGATWINANGKDLYKYVQGKADLVFTCPPYYDLEQYTDHPEDISNAKTYGDFAKDYEQILSGTYPMLKDGGYAVVVVGNVRDEDGNYHNLVGDTISIMQRAGYHFYNEIILATAIASASVRARRTFSAHKKVVKTHQNILFFGKGKEVSINGALRKHIEQGVTATAHHDVLVFKK